MIAAPVSPPAGIRPQIGIARRRYRETSGRGSISACCSPASAGAKFKPVDPVEAWVWLSLAADTGEGDAAAARDQVAKGLTAAEKEDARNRLEALRKDAGAKES
jgi:hypothetical protein